ncbi:MAG: FixH family protein [Nitratireductor sp.]|nr:FixH family protein [Nitratireductor sp.]
MLNFLRVEKFTGWHMLAIMVLFFGVIISVNLMLAFYANSSWTGLVVKNSYVASQEFNERTAERRQQMALGWKADLAYDRGHLSVSLAGPDGKPVAVERFEAVIGRPAFEAEDRSVELARASTGDYDGATTLGTGLWQVDLTATRADGSLWQHSIRFVVKEGQ